MYLIPKLKVNNTNNINKFILTIPYVSSPINKYMQEKSLDIIDELVCQVAPMNSDKHNFIVSTGKILNYLNIDSSLSPNTYEYYFYY